MATVDVVIIGGGIAGLFTLDQLVRDGHQPVLLEVSRLGSGQTVSAQGIIHGGLKYSLSGTSSPSALGVKQMPAVWSECLAGTREPDLSDVTLRSRSCLLWRGGSLASRLGTSEHGSGWRSLPVDSSPATGLRCWPITPARWPRWTSR